MSVGLPLEGLSWDLCLPRRRAGSAAWSGQTLEASRSSPVALMEPRGRLGGAGSGAFGTGLQCPHVQ